MRGGQEFPHIDPPGTFGETLLRRRERRIRRSKQKKKDEKRQKKDFQLPSLHIPLTQMDGPHQLIGREIEMFCHETARGTLLALVAKKDVFARLFANRISQSRAQSRLH